MNTFKISTYLMILFSGSDAFGTGMLRHSRFQTSLNLEDNIAEMIDQESYRLNHIQDSRKELDKKYRKVSGIENKVPDNYDRPLVEDSENLVILRRDKRLADSNPQAYCADRCVSTGNCDVYEDLFNMSPKEVMTFCTECVLSEDEDPCDVPEAMLED